MRRRPAPDPHATEVARRRLEALSRELGLEGAGPRGERTAEPPAVAADLDDEIAAVPWSPWPPRPPGAQASARSARESGSTGWASPASAAREPEQWDTAFTEERAPGDAGRRAAAGRRATGRHALPSLSWRERIWLWASERSGGARQFGAAHLAVVALLVAVSLAVGAWHTLRGSVEEAPVAAPTLSEPPGDDGASDAAQDEAPAGPATGDAVTEPVAPGDATAGAAAAEVVVDVVGKVRRPGIAVLPAGSRVVDALKAAGGARPGVGTDGLNLARPLTDGEQIVVGRSAALTAPPAGAAGASTGAPSTAASPTALVNLNTADQVALETLPGVGPVTAAAILQWRTEHGGFTAVEELLEVSGIGDATLAEIAPHVTI